MVCGVLRGVWATYVPVTKDKIYPQVKVGRNVLRLERGPVLCDEVGGVGGPRGQQYVVHLLPILPLAQRQLVAVEEHVGKVEELGHKLLHVRCRVSARVVGCKQAAERVRAGVSVTVAHSSRVGGHVSTYFVAWISKGGYQRQGPRGYIRLITHAGA